MEIPLARRGTEPAANDLPLPLAYLVAVLLESAFWGVYVVLFGICVWILVRRKGQSRINIPMLLASCTLMFFATLHIALTWARTIIAFTNPPRSSADGSFDYSDTFTYLNSAGIPLNVTSEFVYGIIELSAETALIYRLWVVWNRNLWVTIFPSIALCLSAASGSLTVAAFIMNGPTSTIWAPNVQMWATMHFSVALATNISTTGLLVWRIYHMLRLPREMLGKERTEKYFSTIAIVVESGMLFVVCMLATLVLFVSNYYAKLLSFHVMAQIMGIVPTLIIVRIGLGKSIENDPTYLNSVTTGPQFHSSSVNSRGNHSHSHSTSKLGLRSPSAMDRSARGPSKIVINISREAEAVGDGGADEYSLSDLDFREKKRRERECGEGDGSRGPWDERAGALPNSSGSIHDYYGR